MTQPTAPATTPMSDPMQATPADPATSATATPAPSNKKMTRKERRAAEAAATASPAPTPTPAPMSDPAAADTATPMTDTPAAPAAAPNPATSPAPAPTPQPQTAQAGAAQPAAPGGDQVATIVESEFATYDKDANGSLNKIEFTAWMDALKAKAPNAASKPADPKWNDAAFAQADSDKSTSVSKQELAGFLGGAARAG